MKVKSSVFAVNEQPYCLWELELPKRNIDFLKSVDPGYFSYVVEQNVGQLDDRENRLRAAMSIRLAYYQSAEMFFSYIAAWLQAPDCVYAWLEKCSTPQLRKIVEGLSTGRALKFHRTNLKDFSWLRIAKAVFANASTDPQRCATLAERFGHTWSIFARDFLDENNIEEYNALKHGNRVSPGGFTLSMGLQEEQGTPASAESMQVVGHSKWGTSFFCVERFGGMDDANRSLRSVRHSVNWSVVNTAAATQLLAISTHNVISAILVSNGVSAASVQYLLPSDEEDFRRPWAEGVGVMKHATFDFVMDDSPRFHTTKEALKIHLDKVKSQLEQ